MLRTKKIENIFIVPQYLRLGCDYTTGTGCKFMKIIKTVGGHTSTSSKFVPKFRTQFSLCRLILPQSRVTLILNKLNNTDQKLFDEKFDDPCCIE